MPDRSTAREAARTLGDDPALAAHVDEHGPLALDPAADPFERLVVSLVRQQLSMDAAAAIRKRLFERVEVTPEAIAAADPDELAAVGLSGPKTEYLQSLARAYRDRGYSRAYFDGMDDAGAISELTTIRGIGPWTAKMFLMFALGRPDVFPVEDLGVRRGMTIVCDEELTRAEMCDRAEVWQPYRSYASLYLWRAYEG